MGFFARLPIALGNEEDDNRGTVDPLGPASPVPTVPLPEEDGSAVCLELELDPWPDISGNLPITNTRRAQSNGGKH